MSPLASICRLWRAIVPRTASDIEEEFRSTLDAYQEDLIRRGLPEQEARRKARIDLGRPSSQNEVYRDAIGLRLLDELRGDLRYGLRGLLQRPGFTIVALLTLALGIGVTAVMFSVVNGVLLTPLPYADPSQLVVLQEQTNYSTLLGDLWAFSKPNYEDLRREATGLDFAAFLYNGGTVSTPKSAEYVDGYDISANMLALLGIHVVCGRDFTSADDDPGAPPVAIIGYDIWQSLYEANPNVIGEQIVFDEKTFSIVGVAPPGFLLEGGIELEGEPGIFLPLGQEKAPFLVHRDRHGLRVWARLHSGLTLEQAREQLAVVGSRLAKAYPDSNAGRTFIADPLRPNTVSAGGTFAGDERSALWLLLAAASLVLLIACVNVASLLLARSVSRQREFAIRVAIGAGRGRVVRQCLTESALLGLLGGALGVLLAFLSIRPFMIYWPHGLPRASDVHLDGHVLLFALGVSLLSGFVFGIAPALRVPVRNLEQTLRAGSRTVPGASRPLHSGYVISEIALAVVLLVSAGVLAHTLLRLASTDPGLDIRNVVTGRVSLGPATLKDPAATRVAWDEIIAAAHSVPGVASVATVDTVPMREGSNPVGYSTTTGVPPSDSNNPTLLANSVSPEYLQVMRIPLLEGRFFSQNDVKGKQSVAVVDDVLAQKAFPRQDPIGKKIWFGLEGDPWTVVGVVGHVRYWGLASDDQAQVRAQLYYPFAQVPDSAVRRWSELMSIAVRTNANPISVLPALRKAIRGRTGDQVIYQVHTMEELAASSIARQRFLFLLVGLFAGLALMLSCIGIYGVLAHLTNERVPEIGVRIALGASPWQVLRMVLNQSVKLLIVGIAIGTIGAIAATRVLIHLVDGVRHADPIVFVSMILLLAATGLIASFIPARKASRIDPVVALRQE